MIEQAKVVGHDAYDLRLVILVETDHQWVVEAGDAPSQNHTGVIRAARSGVTDWLDTCCWGCGTEGVAHEAGGRLLCGSCRQELLSEAVADPLHLARHAYWESHALGCCWRCMTRAVDPDDEVGICSSCREQIGTR